MASDSQRPATAGGDGVEAHDYRTLIDALHGIVWRAHAQPFRFSFVSPQAERLTGYPASRWIADPDFWLAQVDPRDRPALLATLHGSNRSGAHACCDFRLRRADGTVVWLHNVLGAALTSDGETTICGVMIDISARVAVEDSLRASEQRFRRCAEIAADWFWETDADHRYTRSHGDYRTLTGEDFSRYIGSSRAEHLREGMSEADRFIFDSALREQHPFRDIESLVVHDSGEMQVLQSSGSPLHAADGSLLGWYGATRDVTEQRRLADRLVHLASHDSLTGLVNRREFELRLGRAIETARRDGTVHTLCYMDLDQFKVINDTCGHSAGDELLRQLGLMLRGQLRGRDTLARLGGDEFGVLLEHCDRVRAREVAEGLRRRIADYRFAWHNNSFAVGASIGVVALDRGTESTASAMSAADAACYAAKDGGRNRIHVDDEDDFEVRRRQGEMQWVSRLTRAMETDAFELWAQPIQMLDDGDDEDGEAHYELLLRMRDDDGALVFPGAFLPAAERYGLSSRLDRWVVSAAVNTLAAHPHQLARLGSFSINLSGQSVTDETFLADLVEVVSRAKMPYGTLCFEITETAAIANLVAASHFIDTLRQHGCAFALDDFGSGLSSFAYLKNLPVDFLKIDGMFIRDVCSDPIDLAMVRSIHEIGHLMGKRTIAEFVDSAQTLEAVRRIGIDGVQGYAVGRPRPLLDVLADDSERRVAV